MEKWEQLTDEQLIEHINAGEKGCDSGGDAGIV